MTSSTPDRIYTAAERFDGVEFWDAGTFCSFDDGGVPYLLYTPARENAEELLEALEEALNWANQYRWATEWGDKALAAIAKAKGEA